MERRGGTNQVASEPVGSRWFGWSRLLLRLSDPEVRTSENPSEFEAGGPLGLTKKKEEAQKVP